MTSAYSNIKQYGLSDGPSECRKSCVGDCKYFVWLPGKTWKGSRLGYVVDHNKCYTYKTCAIKWNAGSKNYYADAVGYKTDC